MAYNLTHVESMDTVRERGSAGPSADLRQAARQERMAKVVRKRTRYITVVLENIHHPHNASAVLRTCDSFGIQDLHIVEIDNEFVPVGGIARGAAKWLTLHHYGAATEKSATGDCFRQLRDRGYTIAVAVPEAEGVPVARLPLDQKIALCFGSEKRGLSAEAYAGADMRVHVPMVGFTESLNLSVAVAVALYELTNRLRSSELPWQLTAAERRDLTLDWLLKQGREAERLLAHFFREH